MSLKELTQWYLERVTVDRVPIGSPKWKMVARMLKRLIEEHKATPEQITGAVEAMLASGRIPASPMELLWRVPGREDTWLSMAFFHLPPLWDELNYEAYLNGKLPPNIGGKWKKKDT